MVPGYVMLLWTVLGTVVLLVPAAMEAGAEPVSGSALAARLDRFFGVQDLPPCPGDRQHPRFVFISPSPHSSPTNMLRGVAVHAALRKLGYASLLFRNSSGLQAFVRSNPTLRADVCIVVKKAAGLDACRICKQLGAVCYWDTLDYLANPGVALMALEQAQTRNQHRFDGIIAGSEGHKAILEQRLLRSKRVLLLPHLHTNIGAPRPVLRDPRQPPKVISSVHSALNALPAEVQSILSLVAREFGAEYRDVPGAQIDERLLDLQAALERTPGNFEAMAEAQHYFHKPAQATDLAVIWPPANANYQFLRERPITRLVFWASHGVPVVVHESMTPYIEVLRILQLTEYLVADSVHTLATRMRNLLADADLRERVSQTLLAAAEIFTPQNSAEVYARTFCRVLDLQSN